MVSKNLLATSPTLERICESVSKFYCGMAVTLSASGDDTWKVVRNSDGKVLDGVIVLRRRNRFRFEMV